MLRRGLLFVVVVLATLGVAPLAAADSTTQLELCGSGSPAVGPPCVVSVKRDGSGIPYNQVLEAGKDVVVASKYHITGDPTKRFTFTIQDEHGGFGLDPDSRYEITLNLGPRFRGETFARGHHVIVERTVDGGGNTLVTFAQNPVRMADDSCSGSGICSLTATRTLTGALDGWIDDLRFVSAPVDRAAMRGFDLASNVDWVSSPLELDYVTNSIFLRVANAHFEDGGITPFVGFAEFKLPFAMLRRLYEVDDPGSLTAGAFAVTGAGGAATTVVDLDAAGHTVHVQVEGLTFSRRRLRVRGDVRPGRPHDVAAVRKSPTNGRIRFSPATPRGSEIRDYKATCRGSSRSVTSTAWVIGPGSPLILRNLHPGIRYTCTVRARSRAGRGRIARVAMPRFA